MAKEKTASHFFFILMSFMCFQAFSLTPLLYGQQNGPPSAPTLAVSQNQTGGGYTITWNKWWGTDGTSWSLLANGQSIYTASLTASTNGQQTGSYVVKQDTYQTWTYQVSLINAAGQALSNPVYYADQGASLITCATIDAGTQARQITLNLNQELDLTFAELGVTNPNFVLASNNKSIYNYQLSNAHTIKIIGQQAGRASLSIIDPVSGNTRYLGIRVRDAAGNLPKMPNYIAMGSVSQDTSTDLSFWRSFDPTSKNHRMDVRYIYLNGGPKNQNEGWRTWTTVDGFRATSYIRESLKLGMIPFFVYYNIPDGGESYYTDQSHLQNFNYMEGYFTDLQFALQLALAEAKDEMIGFILEPDLLGYFAQNSMDPAQVLAYTNAAYTTQVLDPKKDPTFPNTLAGTVQAINYIIRKYLPNAYFGWQVNLWASPPGGYTTSIPGTGLMHLTDTLGIPAGRQKIMNEALAIADYYIKAGVLTSGANFICMDKYGLDAGAEGKSSNPVQSTWFWNAVHWTNYLQFAKALSVKSQLPVILWQLPVGHINQSQAQDPYTPGQLFPTLTDSYQHYEDSAPDYFLGDSFVTTGNRLTFFGTPDNVANVNVSGSTVTWGSNLNLAQQAGVQAILFGAGVGDSTQGTGAPPTDGYWWITKIQNYFANPVPICSVAGTCPTDNSIFGGGDNSGGNGGGGGNNGGGGNTGGGILNFPTNLSYTQTKTSGWGTGAQFTASFVNTGSTPITALVVKFLVTPQNFSVWNVNTLATDSSSVTVGLPAWKGPLAPHETFTFGFVIQPEMAPTVQFISLSE